MVVNASMVAPPSAVLVAVASAAADRVARVMVLSMCRYSLVASVSRATGGVLRGSVPRRCRVMRLMARGICAAPTPIKVVPIPFQGKKIPRRFPKS
jgi:hypothetical protein